MVKSENTGNKEMVNQSSLYSYIDCIVQIRPY